MKNLLDDHGHLLRPVVLILSLFLLAPACVQAKPLDKNVRSPCCAGTWYPGDPYGLAQLVGSLVAKVSPPHISGKPIAVIAPHAGYRFSAPVSAAAYAALRGYGYKRVIVLAFSHRLAFTYKGVDVPKNLNAYQTPLGLVPIDREICDCLLEKKIFSSHSEMGREEHSLELQLPFLQRVAPGFKLVPLLVGRMSLKDYTLAAQAILPLIDEKTLLVTSSDFTHFGPNYGYRPFKEDIPDKLQGLADDAMASLRNADFDGFAEHEDKTKDTICGRVPILLLLRILSMRGGALGVRAAIDKSGRMMGDWTDSVTYQSVVFVPRPQKLGPEDRQTLLRMARQTITAHLNGKALPRPDPNQLSPALRAEGASFVTLRNRGRLRGCIGNMVANGPLYESVMRNAVNACEDFRFKRNPVTSGELDEIDIEISYLGPLKRISSKEEIVVGRDGIFMTEGRQAGVLLPQVAYELGCTRDELLVETISSHKRQY